jgi:hypothetical protein
MGGGEAFRLLNEQVCPEEHRVARGLGHLKAGRVWKGMLQEHEKGSPEPLTSYPGATSWIGQQCVFGIA